MKGKYKTENGLIVEIVEYDAINRSVMVTVNGRGCEWFPEKEIEKWECLEPIKEVSQEPIESIDETSDESIHQEAEEKPKKKRTYKKKPK